MNDISDSWKIQSRIKEDARSRSVAYILSSMLSLLSIIKLTQLGIFVYFPYDTLGSLGIFCVYFSVYYDSTRLLRNCRDNILKSTNDVDVGMYHLHQLSLITRKQENSMYLWLIGMLLLTFQHSTLYAYVSTSEDMTRIASALVIAVVVPMAALLIAISEYKSLKLCKYNKPSSGKGYTNAEELQP